MKAATYPLSADPIHNGHAYVIKEVVDSGLFDKLHITVGDDKRKNYTFSKEERMNLVRKVLSSMDIDQSKVEIDTFSGLLRNYARSNGIDYIIRGGRNGYDFDYEVFLSDFNGKYGLKTLVIPSDREVSDISSTVVRLTASEAGLTHEYVHPSVKQALEEKLNDTTLIGVTGNMGSGKSTYCREITKHAAEQGIEIHHIDYDYLVRSIYDESSSQYQSVKKELAQAFGDGIFEGNTLDRKKLAGIVFGDDKKREELAKILKVPSRVELENRLKEMKGIVLIDAAYFTEYNMLPIVNNNMIQVRCEEKERYKRIYERDGLTEEQAAARLKAQNSYEATKQLIQEEQAKYNHGLYHEVNTTHEFDVKKELEHLLRLTGRSTYRPKPLNNHS